MSGDIHALDTQYRTEGWGKITDAALGIAPTKVESQAREVARWAHSEIERLKSEIPQDAGVFDWAIVEIMGHRKLFGRIREEERFGAKMLRIDIPKPTAPRTLFDAADDKPEEPAVTWVTQWYGGPSIFSMTLTDEATVMRANAPYQAPSRYLAPPDDDTDDDESDYDMDRYSAR